MSTSLSIATEDRASDLEDTRCEQHDSAGTFVVESDDFDGAGRRDIACDRCVSDLIRHAHMRGSFRPPQVTPIDLALYSPWTSGAVA